MQKQLTIGCALIALTVVVMACSKSTNSDNDDDGPNNPPPDSAGVSWQSATSPVSTPWSDLVWSGDKFVATSDYACASSPDGRTWTTIGGVSGRHVSYRNSGGVSSYVAAKPYSLVYRSADGINWSQVTITYPSSLGIYHMLDWNASFTAYAEAGMSGWVVMSSDDGTSWSISPISARWYAATNSPTLTVMVGPGGTINTSNGAVTSPTTVSLNDVVFTGNRFVAVGDSGTIIASTDGTTWYTQSSLIAGTINSLSSVAWSGTLLVAVGRFGTIMTSPNGTVWTKRTSNTTQDLGAVEWNGTRFVIVGNAGTILTSP